MIKFIKMKKKIIFAVATGFFAVATVFNMNLLQATSGGDITLERILVMAQAQNSEYGGGSGSCAFKEPDGTVYYGLSKAAAQNSYDHYGPGSGANWCCDSCGSTSWY